MVSLTFTLVNIFGSRDLKEALLPFLDHPFAVQVFAIVLSFVVVYRTNCAVQRYFDGIRRDRKLRRSAQAFRGTPLPLVEGYIFSSLQLFSSAHLLLQ